MVGTVRAAHGQTPKANGPPLGRAWLSRAAGADPGDAIQHIVAASHDRQVNRAGAARGRSGARPDQ